MLGKHADFAKITKDQQKNLLFENNTLSNLKHKEQVIDYIVSVSQILKVAKK